MFNYHRQFFKICLDSSSLKNAETIKDTFEIILMVSKRQPNLIRIDRGKEFFSINFQNFLNNNNIKHFSRNTSIGAVVAQKFKRTIRDLPKRPVFEKGDGNWIDVLPGVTEQDNSRIHSSAKLTPIPAPLKMKEGFVYQNLLDKRKKIKPKFQINDLVRDVDIKRTFSKEIPLNCPENCIKLQKNSMIQYRVIYQNVMTQHY